MQKVRAVVSDLEAGHHDHANEASESGRGCQRVDQQQQGRFTRSGLNHIFILINFSPGLLFEDGGVFVTLRLPLLKSLGSEVLHHDQNYEEMCRGYHKLIMFLPILQFHKDHPREESRSGTNCL